MSTRLTIAQSNRLRTYDMLKGQPESVQLRALGPDYKAEMEALRLRLEREADPRPDIGPDLCLPKRGAYNDRVIELLGQHYESGEALPGVVKLSEMVGLSAGRISNITSQLQREGHLVLENRGTVGWPIRHVVKWEPPL